MVFIFLGPNTYPTTIVSWVGVGGVGVEVEGVGREEKSASVMGVVGAGDISMLLVVGVVGGRCCWW